jgi:dynein heavy chain
VQAVDYSKNFDQYSYLWLDDRSLFLKQFLLYGHQLTAEELEIMMAAAANEELAGLTETPPTTKLFKEQVIISTGVT